MSRSHIIKIISILGGILTFIFLVKLLYIDSDFGFSTEILELNYSAFPKCVDAIICVIFWQLITYALLQQFCEFIINKIGALLNSRAKKLANNI